MLRFLDAANVLTLIGLTAAFLAALLAVRGQPAFALVALIVSGLCDLFDGAVARRLSRTPEEARFGGRLDSVVDACSFGLAPAIVLSTLGAQGPLEVAALTLYCAAAVWRLAYFDTVGLEGEEGAARYYIGLPVTYAALVIPLAALLGFVGPGPLCVAATVSALGLALLFVSPVRVRKPFGPWYGVLLLVAIALIATYWAFADRFARGW